MILRHILVKHEYEAQDIERKLNEAAAENDAAIETKRIETSERPPEPEPPKNGPGTKARKAALAKSLADDSPAVEVFGELAKKFSSCSSREVGGSLGDLTGKMNRLDDAFREAAEKLSPGERTGPIRTQFGYHIIFRER